MLSEPRTINYLGELIHVPVAATVEGLRSVYAELCEREGYENFIRTADGCRLEGGAIEGQVIDPTAGEAPSRSTLTFRKDRIQLIEENTDLSLEQYRARVVNVATVAMKVLKIPLILVHHATARAITTPNCYRSAGDFLAENLIRVQPARIEPLGRPTSFMGLRLFFPATADQPGKFNVRVETYLRDPRSLYLENVAMFQAPIKPSNVAELGQQVETAVNFVSNNLWSFLTQFDIPREGGA